ncbi:hypothetical protein RU639_007232 [Aspergillus parasiticus]
MVSQEYFRSELSWPAESILTSQTLQSYAVVGFLYDGNVLVLGYDSSRVFDHSYLDRPIIQIVRSSTLLASVINSAR